MLGSLQRHWSAYRPEAVGLDGSMICADLLTTAFMAPTSPLRALAESDAVRHLGIGIGMAAVTTGLACAIARSGAHLNAVVTLAFFIRGRIGRADTL